MKDKRMNLEHEDLFLIEPVLVKLLSQFLSFSGHAVFFPKKSELLYLASENRLIIPLVRSNINLGSLMLEGVSDKAESILPFIEQIALLCMENAILTRSLDIDRETGLSTEDAFFGYVTKLCQAMEENKEQNLLHKMCLGIIVLRWPDAIKAINDFGFDFCSRVFLSFAEIIRQNAPEECICTQFGKFEGHYEYGLLIPAAGRQDCVRIALNIIKKIEKLSFKSNFSPIKLKPRLYAGIGLYPQDIGEDILRLPVVEQIIALKHKTRIAVNIAEYSGSYLPKSRIMEYNKILIKGGKILEVMDDGKILINLGHSANANTGMKFQISDMETGQQKGSLVITEPGENHSIARILYMDNPEYLPMADDNLCLILHKKNSAAASRHKPEKWNTQENFFANFSQLRDSRFVIGICSLPLQQNKEQNRNLIIKTLASQNYNLPALSGIYGNAGLIFYHAEKKADDCMDFYMQLAKIAYDNSLELASGLFEYPFLNFARGESESACLKALEYARLLPYPHIGVFNSVALNISADKQSAEGNIFGAIKEYELALLADPENANVWNSLGIAKASLGKNDEAMHNFNKALLFCKDSSLKAKIYYNIGALFQKQKNHADAESFFNLCIKTDASYEYAWIRLGQIFSQTGRLENAKEAFKRVIAEKNGKINTTAARHLANLEAGMNKIENARSLLHDAILQSPKDPYSLADLATLYLDEDPAMAEMLAKKSMAFGGGKKAREILAKAYIAQNRKKENEQEEN